MRRLSLALAVFLALPQLPLAAESVVSFTSEGHEVVGTLNIPDGPPAPAVLLLHGFGGARNEMSSAHVPEGVFAFTAAQLAEAGFASLRIDFRGSGDSKRDMTFSETTFETQIADGRAALDYLRNSDAVLGDTTYLIGWSQGGLVAASLAGRTQIPKAVAIWNAVADPPATYGRIFGPERLAEGLTLEDGETLPWDGSARLARGFFEGVASHDPLTEIAQYSGPLLVVQGVDDTLVVAEDGAAYHAAHTGPGRLWTAEMGHVFNLLDEGETFRDMVNVTIDFFEETRQ